MSKYIDAEKLKAEIERRRLSNRYIDTDGYEQELLEIITSLQQEQPEVCTVTGWVVRLKNGDLGLSTDKPYFRVVDEEKIICCDNGLIINNSLFPELKWEDEPIEVELTIKRWRKES